MPEFDRAELDKLRWKRAGSLMRPDMLELTSTEQGGSRLRANYSAESAVLAFAVQAFSITRLSL
jgi:hypothetical protein